jgi:hypothetical protein
MVVVEMNNKEMLKTSKFMIRLIGFQWFCMCVCVGGGGEELVLETL